MFNWEGVSEFVAVAEAESFTKASQRLGISTAQVSRQISALETRLAAKLFHRTTRKVSVTEVGRIYYQHCRQVLDGLEEAERAITNLQTSPRGLLKITAPVTYGEMTIAPLVNDFAALYPELEVKLNLSNQKLDLVDEGYDLAIRLGHLEDSSMMAKKLSSRTQYVCASPDYLSTYGIPHSLSELDQHNCLIGTMDYWRFQENGKTRNVRVKGSLSCNSGHALVDAAIKGIGIVQLPDYYVLPYIESGELTALLEQNRQPEEGIWALYPQNRHLSPKVRMLLEHLNSGLKSA
ncbi:MULTISPECIES: LysR substrate-binding domain-containing protein [Shewanella]|uniref:LysR substrate-binding domain-containing protein n=1 Tax=Shewanella fidelis TaxID=173509 RepID=A0AAW8NU63_9GAMM|nr:MULTISPECIES: LysR substrate-binding domain-containing protein [Shewanella]MDR8526101.1 LysR substrate-binding domain-containing protein [Shewanella fidelis]MDW4813714.1 LysR substrate-binding domain-containing protein [Shewanella fidelis]MDW4817810.1 LysR substrate-binding domain-containing protein [Shewanella fidelis]MDW4821929.1 LysR substrate-binding domain-containing protein [Shewanella fidelis]MDW4826042.1 LysR substrate-binding domain-containing protein [Shewanella fidelis]